MDAAVANKKSAPKAFLSPRARRRKLWLAVHKWIGLLLLVPMAALGFTGSALVWPNETEMLVYPDRQPVEASADGAEFTADHIRSARIALADYGPIAAMRFGEVGDPVLVGAAPHAPPHWGLGPPTRMSAYVDPASGKILDVTESTGGFMWYMHAIHGHLLLKGIGRDVVGVMGIILIASAISGLYLWWPGRRRIGQALKWQKKQGKTLNLHKQSGFYLSLILMAEAVTGVWICYPAFFAAIVEPQAEQAARHEPRGPAGKPLPSQDSAWAKVLATARAEYDARPLSITAPTDIKPIWQVTLMGDKGPVSINIEREMTIASVDYPAENPGRAEAMKHIMEGLHAGAIGGRIWQWLVFVSGIIMTFLSLSGIYIWARSKK